MSPSFLSELIIDPNFSILLGSNSQLNNGCIVTVSFFTTKVLLEIILPIALTAILIAVIVFIIQQQRKKKWKEIWAIKLAKLKVASDPNISINIKSELN